MEERKKSIISITKKFIKKLSYLEYENATEFYRFFQNLLNEYDNKLMNDQDDYINKLENKIKSARNNFCSIDYQSTLQKREITIQLNEKIKEYNQLNRKINNVKSINAKTDAFNSFLNLNLLNDQQIPKNKIHIPTSSTPKPTSKNTSIGLAQDNIISQYQSELENIKSIISTTHNKILNHKIAHYNANIKFLCKQITLTRRANARLMSSLDSVLELLNIDANSFTFDSTPKQMCDTFIEVIKRLNLSELLNIGLKRTNVISHLKKLQKEKIQKFKENIKNEIRISQINQSILSDRIKIANAMINYKMKLNFYENV